MDAARPHSVHAATGRVVEEAARGHIVQYYSSDEELVVDVIAHLAPALELGGTALAIATEAHRVAFANGLAELGIEPRALSRLRLLDAEETLQRCLLDGEADADSFHEVVGELVASSRTPLHAYGEMVMILWESGRVQQAIDLEILWNRLGDSLPFVLLCGYPAESCRWKEQANELGRLYGIHSAVAGSAAWPERRVTDLDVPMDLERVLNLPRERTSVRTAREFVREVATGIPASECDVAELVVSEIVTNALEHGRGDVVVRIVIRDRSVIISVSDGDSIEPMRKNADVSSPRGRGLQIVEALSIGWGVNATPDGGKTVWAELGRKGHSQA